MYLRIFNPDNDMALADFQPGYTAPQRIRTMVDELAEFPLSWADAYPTLTFNPLTRLALLHTEEGEAPVAVTHYNQLGTLYPGEDLVISPWGWSPALVHALRLWGCPEELFPDSEKLIKVRRLSSRETAVEMLADLMADNSDKALVGESRFCRSWQEAEAAIKAHPKTILKAPWSSSGKGIRMAQSSDAEATRTWVERTLRLQGGVAIEPLYPRLADLAMEFLCHEGSVSYEGLSLFATNEQGAYRGNLLMPEREKEEWVTQYIAPDTLTHARKLLMRHIATRIAPHYDGPLGIDMIITTDHRLHPLIEINLRTTMGMAALFIERKRGLQSGQLILDYAPGKALPPHSTLLAGGEHFRIYLHD